MRFEVSRSPEHRVRCAWLVVLASIGSLSCGGTALTDDDAARVRTELEEFVQSYVTHTNDFDAEALSAMYSESPDFYWMEANRNLTYESRDEVMAGLTSLEDQFDVSIDVSGVRIVPISLDAATVSFHFTQNLQSDRSGAFTLVGLVSTTVVREAGQWRFLTGHATANMDRSRRRR